MVAAAEDDMTVIRMETQLSEKLGIGVLLHEGVRVEERRGAVLEEAVRGVENEVRAVYGSKQPSEIDGLQAARRLFRSIGVDPTRMRPASEALLRRILKGGELPRINSAVDAANVVSLRLLLPVGLYDAGKVDGDVLLRLGRSGEGYDRIGSGRINLEDRIGLFDSTGGFGNPTGDSFRTSVNEATERLLFVLFVPSFATRAGLEDQIDFAARTLAAYTGGREGGRAVLGCGGESIAAIGP
jgi:DNA/RNA-binding domain of Phe-tRNA-synthetase-like protein